ncbi:hypothetical protein C4573_06700 [Candidatus Woesearchaeota archaeon]|nr:MAG: hypothetical protein C4573_06700 [Candidatus Woesearchaeota archaeon]
MNQTAAKTLDAQMLLWDGENRVFHPVKPNVPELVDSFKVADYVDRIGEPIPVLELNNFATVYLGRMIVNIAPPKSNGKLPEAEKMHHIKVQQLRYLVLDRLINNAFDIAAKHHAPYFVVNIVESAGEAIFELQKDGVFEYSPGHTDKRFFLHPSLNLYVPVLQHVDGIYNATSRKKT